MFESFSSRANQSAVDRLIQMATGKKAAEPVEEKPAAPVAVEESQPAEASVAVEAEPAAEAMPESAVEAAPEVQAETAAPMAAEAVAESPVASAEAAPEAVQEEVVDERPFHEPVQVAEESLPVEAAAAEPVSEPVAEAAPEAESAYESASSPEAVVEEAAASEAAAAENVAEPVAEGVAEPVAEGAAAAAEEAVDDRPFQTEAAEAPVEEAAAEAGDAEAKTAEEFEGEKTEEDEESFAGEESGAATERRWGQEAPVGGWIGSQTRTRKLPLSDGREGGSLTTEEYRRLKAERRRTGADVVPSPQETSYLKMGRTSEEVTEQELRRMSQDPMWKTLVQFKGWLPVVTSLLPVLDMASGRSEPGGSAEIKDTMDGLLVSHRDVRATLQSQTTELKRVEEEVAKLRDAAEKTAFEQTAMSDDVRSMQRLVKNASMYLGILLGLLVAVVGYMAFLVFSYLNHPVH